MAGKLVLSRELDQSIAIGPDITVTICRIDATKVRIGIEAPHHIAVHRTELLAGWERGHSGTCAICLQVVPMTDHLLCREHVAPGTKVLRCMGSGCRPVCGSAHPVDRAVFKPEFSREGGHK